VKGIPEAALAGEHGGPGVTGVNNASVRRRTLPLDMLDGGWPDAGTFDSLGRANTLVTEPPVRQ
jgi:hypothetical protein